MYLGKLFSRKNNYIYYIINNFEQRRKQTEERSTMNLMNLNYVIVEYGKTTKCFLPVLS